MRIAILTPTFSRFSGPDRVVEGEAEALSKGNDVTVFALKGDIQPKNYRLVLLGAPKSAFFERIYRLFFFMGVFKIRRITNLLMNFDEIVSFMYPMTILACNAKKKFNKRYVYYDMGIAYPELFPKLSERIYLRIFKWLTNKTIKNADKAICISNFLKNELQKEVNLPAEVQYVNIDKSRFNKNVSKKKAGEIRKKFNIKGPMLLYVGRISPHKGIHLLIKAFKIVNEKLPDAKLVVVGKHTFDDYSKELKNLANENVIFAGFVPDEELPYFYKAADLYTTATLWEGFDMPACLMPDSKIKTNQGYKTIGALQRGEFVTTHKGTERRIIAPKTRYYTGDLFNIKVYGCSAPLRITPEHKIYAIVTTRCKANRVCKPGCSCKKRYYTTYKPEWVEARNLKKGDALIYPYKNNTVCKSALKISDYVKGLIVGGKCVYYKYGRVAEDGKDSYEALGKSIGLSKNAIYRYVNKRGTELKNSTYEQIEEYLKRKNYTPRKKVCIPNKIRTSPSFMRLAGYYLSEGCATSSKTVLCFSFNSNEKEYHADVLGLMSRIFDIQGTKEIKGNGCRINYSSQILNMFFSSLFGRGSKNKSIPPEIINAPKKEAVELIRGLWRGDGTVHTARNGATIVSYSTASPKLAEQMRDILLRLGVASNIKFNRRGKREEYTIEVTGRYKRIFCKLMGIKCAENRERTTHSRCWLDGKCLYSQIRRIKKQTYSGQVCNLEVDKYKSYVTLQGAVHNCEAQAVGKKVVAFNIGSHPEVIKSGVLVEPRNIEKFAEAIIKSLK